MIIRPVFIELNGVIVFLFLFCFFGCLLFIDLDLVITD